MRLGRYKSFSFGLAFSYTLLSCRVRHHCVYLSMYCKKKKVENDKEENAGVQNRFDISVIVSLGTKHLSMKNQLPKRSIYVPGARIGLLSCHFLLRAKLLTQSQMAAVRVPLWHLRNPRACMVMPLNEGFFLVPGYKVAAWMKRNQPGGVARERAFSFLTSATRSFIASSGSKQKSWDRALKNSKAASKSRPYTPSPPPPPPRE